MNNVSLSAGMRSNLVSLQSTSKSLGSVQERLASGRKVNSAIDNPTNFFAAANLNDRAGKLDSRLDGMGQAISTLKAADNAITAMRSLVSAMKGVVDEALASSDSSDRASLGKQFNELIVQMGTVSEDADYKGVNLLQSAQSDRTAGGAETLTVQFNEDFGESTLEISGVNIQGSTASGTSGLVLDDAGEIVTASDITGERYTTGASGTNTTTQSYAVTLNSDATDLTSFGDVIGIRSADLDATDTAATAATNYDGTGSSISWVSDDNYQANLQAMVSDLEAFDQELINNAKSLSQNVNIVSIRQDFTSNLINTLEEGADKLTLADLNEEGANLLALQTSQQLGIQSLSLASQSNQSVLSIIG